MLTWQALHLYPSRTAKYGSAAACEASPTQPTATISSLRICIVFLLPQDGDR
jgi:hypothetical protein